jgi:hypothetical protein
MRPRRFGDLRVQIDGRHQAVAEPVGQQRGVISGARADLEYGVAVPYVELFEHPRHQGGLAAGGEQLAVADPGGQRPVRVRPSQPPHPPYRIRVLAPQALVPARPALEVVGHEEMPRDLLERRPPGRVGQPATRDDLPHQRPPCFGGGVGEPLRVHIHASTLLLHRP